MSSELIAEGVAVIEMPMSDTLSTRSVAVRGPTTTLFDAGTASGASVILTEIERRGWEPVSDVFCTHFHHDHSGGLATIARPETRVYAHVAECGVIDDPQVFADAVARAGVAAAIPIASGRRRVRGVLDGQEVAAGPHPWMTLHVPGHTWGHLALWRAHDRLLVAGDAIQGAGVPFRGVAGQGTGLAYYVDVGAYRRSLQRMAQLKPDTLVVAHENPAWSGAVLDRAGAVEAIDYSLDEVDRIDSLVRASLARGATAPRDIAEWVCDRMETSLTPQAELTVRAHLADRRR